MAHARRSKVWRRNPRPVTHRQYVIISESRGHETAVIVQKHPGGRSSGAPQNIKYNHVTFPTAPSGPLSYAAIHGTFMQRSCSMTKMTSDLQSPNDTPWHIALELSPQHQRERALCVFGSLRSRAFPATRIFREKLQQAPLRCKTTVLFFSSFFMRT